MGQFRVCMCFIRKFKVAEVEPPEDVKEAFKKYAEELPNMTAEQLMRFLVEEQGEVETTIAAAEGVLQKILKTREKIGHTLKLDDFHFYLFSAELNLTFAKEVHHDMTAPLSHYFIYTGHNSYLKGNQLTSKCSDVPIENALINGVRVIELDIWPSPKKNDIHVLHGRTMTTPVQLIRCLESINKHAFSTSPYPVIITLEDHLKPDLQAKVAQMLKDTFGEKLYIPGPECLKEFPSPEKLKGFIIISTKPPKEFREAESFNDKRNNSKTGKSSDDDVWGDEPSSVLADQEDGDSSDHKQSDNDQDFEDDEDFDQEVNPAPKSSHAHTRRCCFPGLESDNIRREDNQDLEEEDECEPKISPDSDYKRLIAIPAGKPKGGMSMALKVEPDKVRRLSLSEQAVERAAKSHGKDVLRFTQRNIMRVYPKGIRFNSSNYNPLIGWMHGAQMVAFNMQGYGRSLWLMQGMFRANGGCGYVKKPDFLMNIDPHDQMFNPKAKLPVKKTLKVKVYMGDGWHLDFKRTHFDCYSPPDFYTRVGITGVPCDVKMERTKTMEDKWTPVWNEEFEFPLTVPELALLRIEVHEHDKTEKDDFGGQTCLPVSELRPGIRTVPLHDRKGKQYNNARLLMRFKFVNAL